MDGEHLIHFKSEISIFKFLRRVWARFMMLSRVRSTFLPEKRRGRSAGSFLEQRLEIEPTASVDGVEVLNERHDAGSDIFAASGQSSLANRR